ncbi:MAG: IclR family transcriptional regulator [Actinobacteria bacterium]|nr:IclR family transcriptional regulator [Actinomycetota bacterium]
MDSVSASGVGVLDKAVTILAVLAERGPLGLADLVHETGLARPTVHRLAVALERQGLAGRDDAGRFRLGARLVAWGSQAAVALVSGRALVEAAGPVLAELRDATDESAQLYVRDHGTRVCVAVAERSSGLRDTVPVGAVLPLTAGSGAKVLLAWRDRREPLPPGVDPGELAAVRRRGFASSVAEREPGVASVSAPVFDGEGRLVAAVSVSGPVERLGRRPGARFATTVLAAARQLEGRAGLIADTERRGGRGVR